MKKKLMTLFIAVNSGAILFLFLNAKVAETWDFEPRTYPNKQAKVVNRTLGALAGSYTFAIPRRSDITDFLVQDVCVNDKDEALPLDPATCQDYGLRARDLRIGEDLPYSKFTRTVRNGKSIPVSMQDSYPLWGETGVRYMRTMNGAGTMKSARDFEVGDGYDIIEGDGEFTSVIGTRDPVTVSPNFVWFGENCKKEDGWGLFPNNILTTLKIGEQASYVFKLTGGESCNSQSTVNHAFTYYARVNMRYANNRVLESVKAYHFGGVDPSVAQAIEVFYHTRSYGFSRWEAWKTKDECIRIMKDKYGKPNPEELCTPEAIAARMDTGQGCSGQTERHLFGQTFYMTACSDDTFLMFDKKPVHPFSTPLTTTFALSRNLVKNSDFVDPLAGSYTVVLPQGANAEIKKDENRNSYLELNGQFKGNGGFSQVLKPTEWKERVAVIQSGLLLKGPESGEVKVQIDLYGENDKPLVAHFMTFKTTADWTPARFNVGRNLVKDPIKKIILRIIPQTPGTYQFDELFTAYLPRVKE